MGRIRCTISAQNLGSALTWTAGEGKAIGAAMKIAALIVAAGKGERAGGGVPKQFREIGGISLVSHAVDAFRRHPQICEIWIVIGDSQRPQLEVALAGRPVSAVIPGGSERQHSVRAGIEAVAAAGGCDIVLIHDAARPFLPIEVIDRLLDALDSHDGAVPALPVADTLAHGARELGDVVARDGLYRIQTPQAFRFDAILAAHRSWNAPPATDDAQLLRAAGMNVAMIAGSADLEKVTTASDFARSEALYAAAMTSRTGLGFDVHRLEPGPELWLCGVRVPHDKGLSGHSDADVALHAITDALLGAAALGDIGDHFPPSDPQWRGAASHLFLTHARDLIASLGARIDHIDVTIICEAPRIGPHREAMRARVAELLRLPTSAVSVKATTTERLGFTGRGQGIAAQAVTTISMRKPT